MDWIHCNRCFRQPSPGLLFSLTSCGHMFCDICHKHDNSDDKCKMCNSPCKMIMLIPNQMKDEVKDFFSEPDDMLKKLIDVMDFQKQHRLRLTAHWVSLNKKLSEAKEEIKRLSMVTQKMYNDLKELHKQNKALKIALNSHEHYNTSKYKNAGKTYSPFTIPSTPKPVFFNSSVHSSHHRESPQQRFQSSLLTPRRLIRPRNRNYSSSNESVINYKNSSDDARETILLTPPSTIKSYLSP